MDIQILQFGKYKGQPIQCVLDDNQYIEWLLAQSWFPKHYPTIYQFLISNNKEFTDTPEHNRMVKLFLQDDYCASIFHVVDSHKNKAVFDCEKRFNENYFYREFNVESIMQKKISGPKITYEKIFEDGYDVCIIKEETYFIEIEGMRYNESCSIKTEETFDTSLIIECKPSISEDFPAIIRQIRNSKKKAHVILYNEFTAESTTINEVKLMFPDLIFIKHADLI